MRDDPRATALWEQVGRPTAPALLVDGRVYGIVHPSQIASALGIVQSIDLQEAALAWEVALIADLWVDVVRDDWSLLDQPTPSRERSVRELALNVFWFLELARTAWTTHRYAPAEDAERAARREATITDAASLRDFVDSQTSAWKMFALDCYGEDGEARAGPRVETRSDGSISFAELLSTQRWHAAMHLRQATVFLSQHGVDHDVDAALDVMEGLDLPSDPY